MNNSLTLYQRSSDFLWTDPHIAKEMLKLHLDPASDAASRNERSIDAAVEWIRTRVPENGSIVDLGCGPGLYAERLTRIGFRMTGVDISKNSIRFAADSARRSKLKILYLNRSYLADPIPGEFDAALCIYCDFGALIPGEQLVFLEKIRGALAVGGVFIFDVFGEQMNLSRKEDRSWEYCPGAGFWSTKPHWILHESKYFSEAKAWGSRHIILDGRRKKEYITWDTLYNEERIASLLDYAGFTVGEIEKNLVGENEFASSDVLFVKAVKK